MLPAPRALDCLPPAARAAALARSALGLDPLGWASPSQRAWSASAEAVLAALASRGARLPAFGFAILDERALARAARALAPRSPGTPRMLAHCREMPARGDGPARRQAAILHGPREEPLFRALAAALGGAEPARLFVCAHEWAHAWHASRGRPFARAAATRARAPLGMAAIDELRGVLDLSGRRAPRPVESPASLAIRQAEEAFCDGAACFALQACAIPGAAPKIAAFRRATSRMGLSSPVHEAYGAMLAAMPEMPQSMGFDAFASAFCSRGAPAGSRLFGSSDD